MKILLIGATGQVGFALTHALAAAGHDVTVLVRKAGDLTFSKNVRVVTASEFKEATFAALLPNMDCAIYGIGLPEQFTFDSGIFDRVNLNLFKTFLAAMEKSSLRRLIYISTYEVFEAKDGIIRSSSHPVSGLEGLSPYFRAMTLAYGEAITFAKRTATQLTTIHPAAVYGGINTGEGFTNVVENLLDWRLWKMPLVLPGRFPLVHAESLATAIVSSLNHDGAFIVSDGMTSLKSLAQTLRSISNSYVPPQVPAGLVSASIAPLEALGRLLHFRPMLCKVQIDFITAGNEPIADRAAQMLEWKPLALEDGLRRYLDQREKLLAARTNMG
jgi:dihydroflavonol-4-reductase